VFKTKGVLMARRVQGQGMPLRVNPVFEVLYRRTILRYDKERDFDKWMLTEGISIPAWETLEKFDAVIGAGLKKMLKSKSAMTGTALRWALVYFGYSYPIHLYDVLLEAVLAGKHNPLAEAVEMRNAPWDDPDVNFPNWCKLYRQLTGV